MNTKKQHNDVNNTSEEVEKDRPTDKNNRQPHQINIPGFIDEEIGLGDVIKHVTSAMGIKPCSGCKRRAETLNRWLTFKPRRPK